MEWTQTIDAYCERIGPGYWAEPLNAVTNVAFLIAAWVMWRRVEPGQGLARVLVVVLAAIGVGSYLWHTSAQVWAGAADVLPILVFILLYIFAINRDVWRISFWPALGGMALFLPFAAATAPLFARVPAIGSSAGYMPVPLLIGIYAWLLRRRAPKTARGLAAGVVLLLISITFRVLDDRLCPLWPGGTHFIWHLLNAVMLGWMIEVYRRHLTRGG